MAQRQQKLKSAQILKEQQELLAVQRELTVLLSKVNGAINVLKVEELQLKAGSVLYDNPEIRNTTETKKAVDIPLQITPSFSCMAEQSSQINSLINAQEVDVNINRLLYPRQNIEEEDE